jgi:putative ABC transport system permease protein
VPTRSATASASTTFDCEVIGLLAAKGQSSMGQDQDDTVLMPLRTTQRRLTGTLDIGTGS